VQGLVCQTKRFLFHFTFFAFGQKLQKFIIIEVHAFAELCPSMKGRATGVFKATNCSTEIHQELLVSDPVSVRVFAMRRPKPSCFSADQIVNTTSGSSDKLFRQLSPFFLGPCCLYGDHVSLTMENAWQFSKVYAEHADPMTHEPTDAYWRWATAGWKDAIARRFPMGRGAKPLYSLWQNSHLGYIQARKRIYAPLYAEAVQKTTAFSELQELYHKLKAERRPLVLLDHDGWDYLGQGAALRDVIHSSKPKMGHAFVLAGLLQGDHFWLDRRV
jgi:hypothetical protein